MAIRSRREGLIAENGILFRQIVGNGLARQKFSAERRDRNSRRPARGAGGQAGGRAVDQPASQDQAVRPASQPRSIGKADHQPYLLGLWLVRGAGCKRGPGPIPARSRSGWPPTADQSAGVRRALRSAFGRRRSCEFDALSKVGQNKVCLALPTPFRPIGQHNGAIPCFTYFVSERVRSSGDRSAGGTIYRVRKACVIGLPPTIGAAT